MDCGMESKSKVWNCSWSVKQRVEQLYCWAVVAFLD
jgi:hypothetical protein